MLYMFFQLLLLNRIVQSKIKMTSYFKIKKRLKTSQANSGIQSMGNIEKSRSTRKKIIENCQGVNRSNFKIYQISSKSLRETDNFYKKVKGLERTSTRTNLIEVNKRYDQQSNAQKLNLEQLQITTKNWFIFDSNQNKKIGFRYNYKREIASLTKIMTIVVSLQTIKLMKIPLNCLVKITSASSSLIGTSANLKKDNWISIEDLLYGAMLPSGNDAAYSLAEYIGYCLCCNKQSEQQKQHYSYKIMDLTKESTVNYVNEFINQMNIKANKICLYNTRFSNPHGLQNALNYSSAYDITKLSVYASKNKYLKNLVSAFEHQYIIYHDNDHRNYSIKKWQNTNKLLGKGWEGLKTGQTLSAGNCLSSVKEGIYIVVLNSSAYQSRFSDTQKLFEWYKNLNKDKLPTQNLKILNSAKRCVSSKVYQSSYVK